jgi:zinc transporter ZupT
MPGALPDLLPYVLAATGAGLLGGVIARFWTPKVGTRSAIQHFAAGLVIAAIAEELLVESIQAEESLLSTAMLFAGFLCVPALKMLGPGRA